MKRCLLVASVLAVCACGSVTRVAPASSSSPAASSSPSPPVATSSPAATATTRLTFSGAVAGSVASAAPSGTCGRAGSGAAGADLRFQLNGRAYSLSIELPSYHGPGTYPLPPDRASLHTTTIGPGSQFFGSQSGTVTVLPGDAAGTIDADLAGDAGSVHVSGTWSCAG